MAVTVATLVAKLEADVKNFRRDLTKARGDIDQLEKSTGKANAAFAGLKTAATAVFAAATVREIGRFVGHVTQLAVDAQEAGAAFHTTFGPAVSDVAGFVDEFANKAGFANFELEQMLAVTGNVIQGLGGTEHQSAELSTRMATLAGDVASFSNAAGGAQAVLKALQSAINGEREALKTYGLAVSEAEVQQRALLMTGKESVSELSRLDKALATVEVAYEKAGKAVGDLDRTADSAANKQRELAAKFKEAQVAIGQAFLPALQSLLPVLVEAAELTGAFAQSLVVLMSTGGKIPQLKLHAAFSDLGMAIAANKDPVAALTNLFREQAQQGLLTAESVKALAEEHQFTDAQIRQAASGVEIGFRESRKYDDATKDLILSLSSLTDHSGRVADATIIQMKNMEAQTRATHSSAAAFGQLEGVEASFVNHVQFQAIPAAQRYESATRQAAEALDRQRAAALEAWEATQNLAEAQRRAADPAFAIFSAFEDLTAAQDRYNELQAAGKEGTAEYDKAVRDVLRSQADYNVALETFDGAAGAAIGTIIDLAREAGVAEDDIQDMVDTLRGFAAESDTIGGAITAGILLGIGDLASQLQASLGAKIQAALDGTKQRFAITSPSQVFADEVGRPIAEGIALGMTDGALAIEKAQLTLDRALERIAEAGKKALDGFDFRAAVIAVEDAKRGLIAAIEQTSLEAEAAMQATATALSGAGGGAFDALNVRLREREAAVGVAQAQERLRATREGFNKGERSFVDVQAADLALVRAISTLIQAQVTAAGGPQSLLPQLGFGATEQQMFLQGFAGELSLSADQIAKFEAAVANLLQQRLNEMVTAARLPTFHGGGVVPGSGPTPIMAMGGETVLPTQGGMTIVVPLTIDGREVARATATYQRDELVQLARRNGTSGIN